MSREIKYQFWCEERKRMYKWIENFEEICIVDGKLKPVLNNSVYRSYAWYELDYIPREYTGLKDNNKIEIYEGDILLKDGGIQFIVSYKNGAYTKSYQNTNIYLLYDSFITDGCLDDYIVIGNIYENKELLEGDKN